MTTFSPPSPPYLGPPAHSSVGVNKPVNRVVIHCTVSACEDGGARHIAQYFRSPAAGGSAHYVVDPGEVVQVTYDSVIAWHAPPNARSLGVELCDPMTGKGNRWVIDPDHGAMLLLAAKLVAELCLAYDVPARKLSPADLLAGQHGICGHDDVSDAWHQSDHWDPGPAFPWEQFMALVRTHVRTLSRVEPPEPSPAETAKPTRVTRARRLLRRALRHADPSHPRRSELRRALAELPDR